MSEKRVDELETKTAGGQVYLGGTGLRVQLNKGPNTWFQVVTTSNRKQTAMKLGQTGRISFASAQQIGGVLKDWAREHTMDECKSASARFRELAQADVAGRKLPRRALESAWQRASRNSEGRNVDRELLAALSVDTTHGRGGEGKLHKRLKEYIGRTPNIVNLPGSAIAELEYRLASHDSVDVMFCHGGELVYVEVKSRISDAADIRRGIFQCVKYQAVAEAMLKAKGRDPIVRSVLVLGLSLPIELKAEQEKLGVEVIENVNVP